VITESPCHASVTRVCIGAPTRVKLVRDRSVLRLDPCLVLWTPTRQYKSTSMELKMAYLQQCNFLAAVVG